MRINEATANHYHSTRVPLDILKTRVSLDEKHLVEKPTWYDIEGYLQYFKMRDDFRLFTELFFSRFARQIMDLQTLDYRVAYVREGKYKGTKHEAEKSQVGLLSKNFQDPTQNHYLVSEIMKTEISDFCAYGGYDLVTLLRFFKDYLTLKDYKENELFLIKLFISDAFTYQEDRNPKNIAFQIPRVKGVSYKDRLRPAHLANIASAEGAYEYDPERCIYLLKDFKPNVVFDNERILGCHRTRTTFRKEACWVPALPYSSDLNFKKLQPGEAQRIMETEYDGLDPNLCSLYIDYTDLVTPYMERIAYDDEYRKILEEFKQETNAVILTDAEIERMTFVLESRREAFQKVLKM